MYRKYVYSGTTWFDVVSADTEELLEISAIYDLEKDIVRKIANDNNDTGVLVYKNCIYISLFVPCIEDFEQKNVITHKRVSFVLGSDFVITVRFGDVRGFKQAKKILKKQPVQPDTFSLFFLQTILGSIYQHIKQDIIYEIPILSRFEPSDHETHKMLQQYQDAMINHEQVFSVFSAIALEFFANLQSSDSLQQIMDEYEKLQVIIKEQGLVHVHCDNGKSKTKQFIEKIFGRR